ncbi:M23 family metallopeptidase [Magnetococcales bacterium HHB-1]
MKSQQRLKKVTFWLFFLFFIGSSMPDNLWGEPEFDVPLQCAFPTVCRVVKLMDHDQGPGSYDFRRLPMATDNHNGVDLAILDPARYKEGVPVLAAAGGRVLGVRNNMKDVNALLVSRLKLKDMECGNGVMLDHGGGWRSQYCHLKKASIRVTKGMYVKKGQTIGLVGFSGKTTYPHLHFQVWRNRVRVDPYAVDGDRHRQLWSKRAKKKLKLSPAVVGRIGFMGTPVKKKDFSLGLRSLPPQVRSPFFLVWGEVYGVVAGDQLLWRVKSPQGKVFLKKTVTLDKNGVRWSHYVGKKRKKNQMWPVGIYQAEVSVRRKGLEVDYRQFHYIMR